MIYRHACLKYVQIISLKVNFGKHWTVRNRTISQVLAVCYSSRENNASEFQLCGIVHRSETQSFSFDTNNNILLCVKATTFPQGTENPDDKSLRVFARICHQRLVPTTIGAAQYKHKSNKNFHIFVPHHLSLDRREAPPLS
jgi:hypothetical protein